MIQEDALIPYRTSPIPKGPWLVFAPHPDDESLGMGGSLLLAASEGIDVVLVDLTDGSLGETTAEELFENVVSPLGLYKQSPCQRRSGIGHGPILPVSPW